MACAKILSTSYQAQEALIWAEPISHEDMYKLFGNKSLVLGDFRKLSLCGVPVKNSFLMGHISEDTGEKRHCWSLTDIIDWPNSS